MNSPDWDTLDDFKRFIAGPEFPVVLEKLKLSTAGPPVIHHVTFTSDVNLALGKPLTEIVLATVSTPEAKQEFLAASEQVSLATGRMATYGSVECIDNLVAFICGWESEEVKHVLSGLIFFFAKVVATGPATDGQGVTHHRG